MPSATPTTTVICDGLVGRISSASWKRKRKDGDGGRRSGWLVSIAADVSGPTAGVAGPSETMTSLVALKSLTDKLDAKHVEDYLLEEEAYRLVGVIAVEANTSCKLTPVQTF